MRRSSTFSSETLKLEGYRPWALIAVLILATVFEFGFARQREIWTSVENTPTGLIAVQDGIAAQMDVPRVVVLGNSRMIDAVLPKQLDRELGLADQSTFNLSIQAGRPFDYLSFYERHRQRLASAELMILGLDDQMFSQEMDSAEQRFRLQASLEQRSDYQGARRLSFLAGWGFASLDVGAPALSMLRTALRGRGAVQLNDDLRVAWARQVEDGPLEIERGELDRLVQLYYGQWELSPSQVGYLTELIEACRQDGKDVLLVRPPVRDAYRDRVLALEPERFERASRVYEALGVEPLLFDRASELSMVPTHFVDYGHLSETGGAFFTRVVATEIRRAFPELSAGPELDGP